MRALFEKVSIHTSRITTSTYSTSFTLGIRCIHRDLRDPIFSIYGFVRFADEIVDTFHEHDKRTLLEEFRRDTFLAIERGISMNPVLNSFQNVVKSYGIDRHLIHRFLESMEMDLQRNRHSETSYQDYILGSAEVVGLMCLAVFSHGRPGLYEKLRPAAMSLGAAFQKVNFLRDIRDDYFGLGRAYFPGIRMDEFNDSVKREIERDIEADFIKALEGLRYLPASSRFGVYVAYIYYHRLFNKIRRVSSRNILQQRVRIPNYQKMALLLSSWLRMNLRMNG